MAEQSYDLIVIGAGPGGYVAAIRSAQLGMKTAVVERQFVGGRCLNIACIPAKAVLRSAEVYAEVSGSAAFGVTASGVELDMKAVSRRREKVIKQLTGGVTGLLKKHKIDLLEGQGAVTDEGNVRIGGLFDGPEHQAGKVVLATGSVPLPIPGTSFGGRVLDTAAAWQLHELPKRMAIVGAGASGAEIASAFGRFGTEVLLVEMLEAVLPTEDPDISKVVARELGKQNIELLTGTRVDSVKAAKDAVTISFGERSEQVDYLCIAAGRAPDTDGLGVKEAAIKTLEGGLIEVDGAQRTSLEGVYAIGDLTPGPALAHKAMDEGIVAVEDAAGMPTEPIEASDIPRATFCSPQVASMGLTEPQAKQAGEELRIGKFNFAGVGAASVYGERTGLVKIVASAPYGEILGAHIVGPRATDLIAELVATRALEGGVEEVARTVHAHPTLSEGVNEAARDADGWVIHA